MTLKEKLFGASAAAMMLAATPALAQDAQSAAAANAAAQAAAAASAQAAAAANATGGNAIVDITNAPVIQNANANYAEGGQGGEGGKGGDAKSEANSKNVNTNKIKTPRPSPTAPLGWSTPVGLDNMRCIMKADKKGNKYVEMVTFALSNKPGVAVSFLGVGVSSAVGKTPLARASRILETDEVAAFCGDDFGQEKKIKAEVPPVNFTQAPPQKLDITVHVEQSAPEVMQTLKFHPEPKQHKTRIRHRATVKPAQPCVTTCSLVAGQVQDLNKRVETLEAAKRPAAAAAKAAPKAAPKP